MGDCQNYGPFLGPCYSTGPNTGPNLGDPKRDHNFENPPYVFSTWGFERLGFRAGWGLSDWSRSLSIWGCVFPMAEKKTTISTTYASDAE